MIEKSFLIDPRITDPDKFQEQVAMVVEDIMNGVNFRLHCPDPEYGRKFIQAIDKMLGYI